MIDAGGDFLEYIRKDRQEDQDLIAAVQEILTEVKTKGDQALLKYTRQFDGASLNQEDIKVSDSEITDAYQEISPQSLDSLRLALQNIKEFHLKQLTKSWMEPDEQGSLLGQLVRPLERVGIYVPGGTASYPSSVLMNAVPAKVAGVEEIIMVTPPGKDGSINPLTLVAAREAGVKEIYRVGGVQGVAALAFGTESIKRVDKITGPGNIYVTLAKKMVYGDVDIDMLAGPSEILVVADSFADPVYLAADLLSQAELEILAAAILVTPDRTLAKGVQRELDRQLQDLPRSQIAAQSVEKRSAIIITKDLEEALDIANQIGPEHLELMVKNPFELLGKVKNAGAVFLGDHTPEPVGDYWAGPNHILPTGGTARFYSPVNVDTFMKKTSVIYFSRSRLEKEGHHIIRLAEQEGLEGHANAVRVRLEKGKRES
ncbi:MAG: histidinol dehydrogenase [Desulfitobacteriaceae bacterium]|nr:histidinol dehydrogenase [Desulfitobacteriaceae bacterium]